MTAVTISQRSTILRSITFGLLVVLTSCAPKPETALEDTLRAVEQGHCDDFSLRFSAATRMMMGPKLDRTCSQKAAQMAKLPSDQHIAEVRILTRSVTGDVATVSAEIRHQNGSVEKPITVRLVKEDGKWRLEPGK